MAREEKKDRKTEGRQDHKQKGQPREGEAAKAKAAAKDKHNCSQKNGSSEASGLWHLDFVKLMFRTVCS